MAETTTKPTVPVALDWNKAEAHLKSVKEDVMKHAGKSGHNPYLWWAEHGAELESALKVTVQKTPELHAKIMALKAATPTVIVVDPNLIGKRHPDNL